MAWNDEWHDRNERQTRMMQQTLAARRRGQVTRVAQVVDRSALGEAQSHRIHLLLSALAVAAALLLADLP